MQGRLFRVRHRSCSQLLFMQNPAFPLPTPVYKLASLWLISNQLELRKNYTMELVQSFQSPSTTLRLEDFTQDASLPEAKSASPEIHTTDMIDGVSVTPLAFNSDSRGSLCELLTTRDGAIEPIVHVYQVTAEPGSVRAWVYHRFQWDRLALVNGRIKVVLYDIRPNSSTYGMLNVMILGRDHPSLLRIPPLVIHAVQNIGQEATTFVNLPTKAWLSNACDKYRLPSGDPRIPYNLNA